MSHILLIEDEQTIADAVILNLELEDYKVTHAVSGSLALKEVENIHLYDLVILDVMLPHHSGWEICEAIRKSSALPILFVSAKGNTEDKIKGLKLGADDYLAKPFDLEELLLRVQILLKRSSTTPAEQVEQLTIANKTINFISYEVLEDEKVIAKLSKREVELLKLFYEKKGEVIPRDTILDRLWGEDQFPSPRTIDNYILGFRKLFETHPKNPKHFLSIRGVGYKLILE
ncbi:two-component system, OmpR family, alkaline phosphatase synthesis response regulator PhoP [Lishizhenia tianjinensis]|uniref:Two-component system, OmpR family, alkaline phosphatase synthesis response regulator PhoP n=1 Tax=Lishizhenia tianjinensis TaxID=477690 RepID=A0A1I7B3T2_9FLAO|nr:response regulator transcription factor [Lishizhenia tianjinensis]SFT81801.1 two-component system, OmpR family, alkaline phosphatase synthesis response regulator PhoP [Lishizhenia tianjinensis]